MSEATPFIRSYTSNDYENGLHIFFTTLDPAITQEPARTISSYLYYKPYVDLSPSTCFVLDDGTGRAVGYIIGTPDTLYFAERWRETFASAIDQEIVPHPSNPHPNPLMETPGVKDMRRAAYDGECSMLQSLQPTITQALEKYPAHLHINLLPEFQRKGWGGKLMDAFFAEMRGLDVRGVHLGVLRQSKGSIRFYEKMGWRVVSVVLDGGESGEVGVSGRAVCLVKDV